MPCLSHPFPDELETQNIVRKNEPNKFVPIEEAADPTDPFEAIEADLQEEPVSFREHSALLTEKGRHVTEASPSIFGGATVACCNAEKVVYLSVKNEPAERLAGVLEEKIGNVPRIASFVKFAKKKRRF